MKAKVSDKTPFDFTLSYIALVAGPRILMKKDNFQYVLYSNYATLFLINTSEC